MLTRRKGKIIFYKGTNLNTKETYVCDYCKRTMHLDAVIDFRVSVTSFDEHVTTFKKPSLFMTEN